MIIKGSLKDSRGQMTVELVLLTVVFVSAASIVSETFKAGDFLGKLITSPWTQKMSGMIENGVWGPAEETRLKHPGLLDRHSSLRGDPSE